MLSPSLYTIAIDSGNPISKKFPKLEFVMFTFFD